MEHFIAPVIFFLDMVMRCVQEAFLVSPTTSAGSFSERSDKALRALVHDSQLILSRCVS